MEISRHRITISGRIKPEIPPRGNLVPLVISTGRGRREAEEASLKYARRRDSLREVRS